jgi:hypothetical protein
MGVHKGVLEADVISRKKGGLQTTFGIGIWIFKRRALAAHCRLKIISFLFTCPSSILKVINCHQAVIRLISQSSGSH